MGPILLSLVLLFGAAIDCTCSTSVHAQAAAAAAAAAGAPPPDIYDVSGPTEVGSTLIVSGSGLGNATLALCTTGQQHSGQTTNLSHCVTLSAIQQWDLSLKLTLPDLYHGAPYGGTITASNVQGDPSNTVQFNVPEVHWFLGEDAEAGGVAVAGRTLRIFGRTLAWDMAAGNCPHVGAGARSTAAVTLVSSTGVHTRLQPALASCYRLDVVVPQSVAQGEYTVHINNGLYGQTGSVLGARAIEQMQVVSAPLWPSHRWTYGVDCHNLSTCVAAAASAGGGIVAVPKDTSVTLLGQEHIELGARVRLVGAGPSSVLVWPRVAATPSASFQGWITGVGPWQLRNISLSFVNGMGGIAAVHIPAGSVGCRIDRVSVNAAGPNGTVLGAGVGIGFVKQPRSLSSEQMVPAARANRGSDTTGTLTQRSSQQPTHSQRFGAGLEQPNNSPIARHWSVTNSRFVQHFSGSSSCGAYWPHSDAFWVLSAADGEMRGNTWVAACEGYNVESSSRLFFADNHLVSTGEMYSEGNGFSHFAWPQVSEDIYWGNTSQVGNPAAKVRQETMSFDGAASLYYGPVESTDGATVKISTDPVVPNQNYTGLLVHVAAGTGVGQLRRVCSWQGTNQRHKHIVYSTWTLDSPFSTKLDNTSFISIGAYSGHMIFEGNRYINGTQFQLFGTATHVIVAGNTFENLTSNMHGCWTVDGCGGVILWGFSGGNFPCHHDPAGHFPCAPTSWTIEPAFYVQVLNNSLQCSVQLASIGPDYQGSPPGTVGPRSLAHVHRGNKLSGGTDLAVDSATWSVVLEANVLDSAVCPQSNGAAGRVLVNTTGPRAVLYRPVPGVPDPNPPPSSGCNSTTATEGLDANEVASIEAVQGLIARRLGPQYVACFVLQLIAANATRGHDLYELGPAGDGNGVLIRGSSGVALSAGLGFYLKSNNCSWAWDRGPSGWTMDALPQPAELPQPSLRRNVSSVKWRYAYNVVTFGYTTWAWSWIDWEEELDKLALWGVNLPLAAVGQEALWLQLYLDLGLSREQVLGGFFSGPAFLPWNRMGNIQRSWDAPLSVMWIEEQEALQLQILARMHEYGMHPVLPGFAGHVPSALAVRFPNASITHSPSWRGFESAYSEDAFLEPSDPLFETVGRQYYTLMATRWNISDEDSVFFAADAYNEMQPASFELSYLAMTNARIFGAMAAEFPKSVLVMQGWLFLNDHKFWRAPRVEAFLSGVPDESMLILDLASDERVVASEFEGYYNKSWIWNQLQVFGGRRGIYGSLPQTGQGPPTYLAQSSSTMTGIGATPEALEVNPVTWDLLWEMGWRSTAPDMGTWVADYVGRRYGLRADRPTPLLQQAWQVLLSSQYTASVGNYATSQLCWLEQEPQVSYAHIAADRVGQPDGIAEAFRLMLASVDAAEVNISQPSFLYDLVDLGRQLCCNVHSDLAILAGWEFLQLAGRRSPYSLMGANSSVAAVNATHTALVQLIRDLDELLSTHPSFLIGPRIEEATAWAKGNVSAQAALQYQFLNQITIWGPTRKLSVSSGHNDYAAKNGWAGLMGEYYGGRWAIHAAEVAAAVENGTAPHVDTTAALEQFEEAWSRHGAGSVAPFLTTAQGDTIAVARKLLRTYAPGAANTSHYAVFKLMDAVPASGGAGVDMIQAWNTDVGVLTAICARRVAST